MAAPPPPPCRRIEGSWTFSGIVAAYLDLVLAYLFLCASTLAYFAATFLSIFGLSLPCSCSWLRRPLPPPVDGDGSWQLRRRIEPGCLQGFLVDYPLSKVAGVHSLLRRRFPFDADCDCCCCGGYSYLDDANPVKGHAHSDDDGGRGGGGGGGRRRVAARALLEMGEGTESSRGSVSKPAVSKSSSPQLAAEKDDEGNMEGFGSIGAPVEFKGKGLALRQIASPKLGRRGRPRRSISMGIEKSPLGSSSGNLGSSWKGEGGGNNPFATTVGLQLGVEERSSAPVFSQDSPADGDASQSEPIPMDKGLSENPKLSSSYGISESSTIRNLRQALEEEKRAHAALSLELEMERNSAATAANETMAMILRLQEEKAAIEMEARQYQRMIEEKSAYDEEEMDILKEIIIRREREKHMLEKEVEAYRQMLGVCDTKQPLSDVVYDVSQLVEENDSSFRLNNTGPMLNNVCKTVSYMEKTEDNLQHDNDDCGTTSAKGQKSASNPNGGLLSYGNGNIVFSSLDDVEQSHKLGSQIAGELDNGDDCNVKEKSTVTMVVYPSDAETKGYNKESSIYQMTKLQEKGFHKSTSLNCQGVGVASDDLISRHDLSGNNSTPSLSSFENESVLDVHVIDDKEGLGGKESTERGPTPLRCASDISLNISSRNEASSVDQTNEHSDALSKKESSNIHKSCSDMVLMQSPSSSSQRDSWLNLRRISMPYIDTERFKLENEVELLRKRLKLIQQGRERMGFSAEQREKEIHHLRVLEEISCQLQEIRKATEPGKSTNHIPLPSSSQANLKKRRCRSVSAELNESN